jgi:hypothetical protein
MILSIIESKTLPFCEIIAIPNFADFQTSLKSISAMDTLNFLDIRELIDVKMLRLSLRF